MKNPEAYANAIADGIAGVVIPLAQRIADLERSVAALDAGKLEFAGAWNPSKVYRQGQIAIRRGTAFVCIAATAGADDDPDRVEKGVTGPHAWALLAPRSPQGAR
jgi:hypothetical protein